MFIVALFSLLYSFRGTVMLEKECNDHYIKLIESMNCNGTQQKIPVVPWNITVDLHG